MLVVLYVVKRIKVKINATFRDTEHLRFEDPQRTMSPGKSRVFLETGPRPVKMMGRYQSPTCDSRSIVGDRIRLGTTTLTTFISFDVTLLMDWMGVDFFVFFMFCEEQCNTFELKLSVFCCVKVEHPRGISNFYHPAAWK